MPVAALQPVRVLRGRPEPVDEHEADPRYQAVLERLAGRGRFGIRLGLSRIQALLRRLGDPQHGLRGVLIGGTNGKGSTQALVAEALVAAGYRVGQTPKPHLASYRERIAIDGQPIAVDDFVALVNEVLDESERIAPRLGPATEFETLTAAAFTWFARNSVEVGVIEVGLGGRLDATNAWQGGVSAITNVALDHMEHLGPTIVDIAREKAQIIKRGDAAALTGATAPALDVIRRRAARVDVPLQLVEPLAVLGMDLRRVLVQTPAGGDMIVGLLGHHQAANAGLAWAILDALGDAGIANVSTAQRAAAFGAARWPGRLELLRRVGSADVVLDGAHNPHGIAALAAALAELRPHFAPGGVTILAGVQANHWQAGMLDPLREVLPAAELIATGVPDSTNALSPVDLVAAWGPSASAIDDADEALQAALQASARARGTLVVCGSLYLVGHVRTLLVGAGYR